MGEHAWVPHTPWAPCLVHTSPQLSCGPLTLMGEEFLPRGLLQRRELRSREER